ncbi:hypothetical protein [Solitalea lacus]|uniref:hypothetical protein n=1 Tax=Solitalea lacus TaxID=2911172 RepID=UPI001EDAF7B6|nr:hypothetical protein [Solitalea lacus]UKJ07901.1 hypothetical protein L2B55_01755 [Solitalea lacus]
MSKTYKISYKAYFNDRLKEVFFHGRPTYPLYVQLTHERKTIFFKSSCFELFSKSRYGIFMSGEIHGPTIEEIIEKENSLMEFIIVKNQADFSLDRFKEDYTFYSKDLCDVTEEGFINYLYIFFHDEGMPALGSIIRQGSKFSTSYDLVRDLKRALNKLIYDKLIENSFYYAPPYLPLYGFMQKKKKWPLLSLTVMEWETDQTKAEFLDYLHENYTSEQADNIMQEVESSITNLKKSED